jgi:hypothetical protein
MVFSIFEVAIGEMGVRVGCCESCVWRCWTKMLRGDDARMFRPALWEIDLIRRCHFYYKIFSHNSVLTNKKIDQGSFT